MVRVAVGGKTKEGPAERRAREAREAAAAAAAETGPARRGEDDDQEIPRHGAPAARAEVSASASAPVPVQATAAAPVPAVPAPAPTTPVLPDPSAPPVEQLTLCEREIHGAKARFKAKIDGATEAFVDEAGPFLAWVHQYKLYKLIKDNSGKVYRSFPRYLREQHDLSERTGYRITHTIPLLRILSAGGYPVPDLSARQVGALHPVRTQHGDDAVLRVWSTAWATKKGGLPTPDELEKAKKLLGLTTRADEDEETPALTTAADPGAAVERAAKLLVPETVRDAVRKDPQRVRDLVRILTAALDEAEALPAAEPTQEAPGG